MQLLAEIRQAQQRLAELEAGRHESTPEKKAQDLEAFLNSLRTLWRNGEVRPTHRKRFEGPRHWRTRPDPFETVWPLVQEWLADEPNETAKELFERLQMRMPGMFPDAQLRTLQRRVQEWRTEVARGLVMGATGGTHLGIVTTTQPAEELLK